MRAALGQGADRDIVFSLCQYGMGNVWEWGAQVGGNCWRTTGDITDTWRSMADIGFRQAGAREVRRARPLERPGHARRRLGRLGPKLHPTRLTPNEQYTHISLWCLLCSPLLIGCDMTKLDDFTLNLLTNDEVLDVSQDPLGRQAGARRQDGDARSLGQRPGRRLQGGRPVQPQPRRRQGDCQMVGTGVDRANSACAISGGRRTSASSPTSFKRPCRATAWCWSECGR